jgi:hypothetical protein
LKNDGGYSPFGCGLVFGAAANSALNFVIRLGRFSLTEFGEKLDIHPGSKPKQLADISWKRNLFAVSRFSNAEETFYESRLSAMTRPLNAPAFRYLEKNRLISTRPHTNGRVLHL